MSLFALARPGAVSAGPPRGVYSLTGSGELIPAEVLSNPDVDGISVRDDWRALEPREGRFDWEYLDSAIAAAAAAHKKVLLRVNTMGKRPDWVDGEIKRNGGRFFVFDSDGVRTSIPVFWDGTFLQKKKALINALGAHFADNPAVLTVWASFANAASEDWNVPHTDDLIPQWHRLDYSTEKMIWAGKEIIETTMRAFPNQYVTLAEGGDGPRLDPSLTYVASMAIEKERELWPGRLIVQRNSLATYIAAPPGPFASVWRLIWDSQPLVGGQMLGPCYNDPTYRMNKGIPIDPGAALRKSVDIGLSYRLKYLEIAQADVLHLKRVISYAHVALDSQ